MTAATKVNVFNYDEHRYDSGQSHEGSEMFSKCETEFWDCIMVLVKKGYRVM